MSFFFLYDGKKISCKLCLSYTHVIENALIKMYMSNLVQKGLWAYPYKSIKVVKQTFTLKTYAVICGKYILLNINN